MKPEIVVQEINTTLLTVMLMAYTDRKWKNRLS